MRLPVVWRTRVPARVDNCHPSEYATARAMDANTQVAYHRGRCNNKSYNNLCWATGALRRALPPKW